MWQPLSHHGRVETIEVVTTHHFHVEVETTGGNHHAYHKKYHFQSNLSQNPGNIWW